RTLTWLTWRTPLPLPSLLAHYLSRRCGRLRVHDPRAWRQPCHLRQLRLEFPDTSFQLIDLALHAPEHLLQRIRQVRMVQVDGIDPSAVLFYDATGHADDRGIRRHLGQHHRPSPDAGVVADFEGSEHLGARRDDHVVADGRVPLAPLLARAAQHDTLIEGDVLSYLGGFADDDPHAVVDKTAGPDLGAGMDFNPRQK